MEDLQVASVTLLIASIELVTKSDCSSMHEKGTTLIVVTHNQIVADRACKVIQMLDTLSASPLMWILIRSLTRTYNRLTDKKAITGPNSHCLDLVMFMRYNSVNPENIDDEKDSTLARL